MEIIELSLLILLGASTTYLVDEVFAFTPPLRQWLHRLARHLID